MEKKKGLFYRSAVWVEDRLLERFAGRDKGIAGFFAAQRQKEQEICERLYGKGKKMVRYREWRILRMQKILTVAIFGSLLALFLIGYGWYSQKTVTGLLRTQNAAESSRYVLEAELDKKPLGEILVEIPARVQTEEACEILLKEAAQQLENIIPGKNSSLEAVEHNLTLPDSLCKEMVEIFWESSQFDVVDTQGNVNNAVLQEECVVTLTARMYCQQKEMSVSFPVRVIPPVRDQAQRLQMELVRMLEEETTEEKMQEWFRLPDSFEDLPLHWTFRMEPYWLWVFILTIAGCLGIYIAFGQELRKEEQKRQQRLLCDYPGFLSRLTMLAGTGMPIRSVFGRLAQDVEKNSAPVYKEIQRTCREMESGVTQKEAFENFGRRCRLPEYKKCAALLMQHLSRGTSGLLDTLWAEAEKACEERRMQALKKGEEAQTKLLFPMMLMLLVVMVLVMVPACFSFAGM